MRGVKGRLELFRNASVLEAASVPYLKQSGRFARIFYGWMRPRSEVAFLTLAQARRGRLRREWRRWRGFSAAGWLRWLAWPQEPTIIFFHGSTRLHCRDLTNLKVVRSWKYWKVIKTKCFPCCGISLAASHFNAHPLVLHFAPTPRVCSAAITFLSVYPHSRQLTSVRSVGKAQLLTLLANCRKVFLESGHPR